jgi:hypothetical protein
MKVYILSLMVDQTNGPGFTTRDQWISTDKAEIEKKKKTERKKLLDYFGIKQGEPEVMYKCERCIEDFEDMKGKELYDYDTCEFKDPDIQEEFKEFLKNREKCDYDELANTTENGVILADRDGEIFACGCNHENLENGVAYQMYSIESQIKELEKKGDMCYGNRDLDSFPSLTIEEIKATKKVKEF